MWYSDIVMKIGLLLGLLVACMAALMASEPNQTAHNDKQVASPRDPPKTPSVYSDAQNSRRESKALPEEANSDALQWYTPLKRPEWWLVVLAFLTMFTIGWQAIEMGRATNEMRESTKIIKRQADLMERQTVATETAANAANKSAEVAEMALKLADRADILLDSAGPVHHPNSGGVLTGYSSILLTFKNFGRTRGTNARFAVSISVSGTHSLPPPIEPVILGADAQQTVRFPQFREWLTEETFTGISSGEIPLTFQSKVTYQDIFGDSHSSENSGTFMPENGRFRMSGNRAD